MEQLFPILGMLVFALVLYLLIARPQRKKEERRALLVSSVKKGSVIYAGGIRCTVLELLSGSVLAESGPARSKLELDADAIEDVEGFHYKAERECQKALRQSRVAQKGSTRGPRLG